MPNSKPTEFEPADSTSDPGRMSWKSVLIVLFLPLLMVGFISNVSPNFVPVDGVRSGSLGGDFLQEWIGGKLFIWGEHQRLYDLELVQAMQHDQSLVRFQWPEQDYFPMVYPPFYYHAVSPLANLSYRTAARLWLVLMALALSLSGLILQAGFRPLRPKFSIAFGAMMIYAPLLMSLNMGQKGTLWLAIFTGVFVLLRNGFKFSAGLLLGLLVFKPHLALVVGLSMLLLKQWRFAAGAILVVVAALGFSFLRYPQLLVDYVQTVTNMRDYVGTSGYQAADSHSVWAAAKLTFGGNPDWIVKSVAVLLAVVVLSCLCRVLRGGVQLSSAKFPIQFAAMMIATVMLSPHFYSYDLTILLLPMAIMLASGSWRRPQVGQSELVTVPGERSESAPKAIADLDKPSSLDQSLRHALVVTLAVFAMSGMFRPIAEVTHVQPSLFLLLAWLWLLGSMATGLQMTGLQMTGLQTTGSSTAGG